jgi:hypothetical protein
MKLRLFHFFYVLTLFSLICGFLLGLWPFFMVTAIASLATGLVYRLFFKSGRQVSLTLMALHAALVITGLPLTLCLYRAFDALARSGAPDTAALAGDFLFLFGPVCLLAAFIVFIIALTTSRKIG